AAPCGPISRARYERWSLCLAAGDRGAHGAARFGARRRHLLCDPQRNDRRRYSRAHARQHRMGLVLRRLCRCRGDPCCDRRANVLTEWSPLKERSASIFASGFGLLLLLLGVRAVVAVVLP